MRAPSSSGRIFIGTLIIVGAATGLAIGLLNRTGITSRWAELPSPPEPAQRIIAANAFGLWIEARSGARYFLSLFGSSGDWTVTDASNAPDPATQPSIPRGVIRPKLDGMVSTVSLEASINGRPAFLSYAVDTGGSVYRWTYPYFSRNALSATGWMLVGAIAGAALGLLISGLRWPPSRVHEGSAPGEVIDEVLRTPRHPPGF